MKKLFTTIITLSIFAVSSYCQPVLSGGFTGMAGINGTTYSRIATVGDSTGGYAFVCSGKDGKFFASSFSKKHLYIIDPGTFNVIDSMAHSFYAITASNEDNTMFARNDSGVCMINTTTKTITDSVTIHSAFILAERPNSKELWVGAGNKVYVVNYTSGLSVAAPFTAGQSSYDDGDFAFSKGGTLAYKLAYTTHKIYKINAVTKAFIDSAASPVYHIAISPDSSKLFGSNLNTNKVYIMNASTFALLDSMDCGTREPFDLYFHPIRNELWVVHHFKDSISVFNPDTKALIATIKTTSSPHNIAFSIGSAAVNTIKTSEEQVSVYPNPAYQTITIDLKTAKDRTIILFDIAGKKINQWDIAAKTTSLNIATLPKGYYEFYVIEGGIPVNSIKWLKQ